MRCAEDGCREPATALVSGGVLVLLVCGRHAARYVSVARGHTTTRALRRAPHRRCQGA